MNDLKKPTSLIAGTNIIFSVGSFLYLYKRLEQLEKENSLMKKDMHALATKLSKFNNEDLQTEELLKDMNKKVSSLKRDVSKVENLMIEDELKLIKDALAENDIDIKSPIKKKSKSKKYKYVSSEESSEYEQSPKKKYKKKDLDDEDLIDMLKARRG
jgi:DNA-binding protein H-NS